MLVGLRRSLASSCDVHLERAGLPGSEQQKTKRMRTSVCGRARSAVAERATTAGICPSVTTRGAVRGSTAAGRIVVGARACACMLAHDLDVDDCPDSRNPPQRMSVIERARHVQGLAERRVRRAQPSEPRAGTVTSLSVRTLTGGDVGIGRDVRPSYVQVVVGAGARKYGSPPAADELFPRSGPLTTWILRCRGASWALS